MEALFILAFVALALHLIWERAHIGLYTGYEKMQGRLPVFVAASIGDVMYTFFAIFLVSLFKDSVLWFLTADVVDYLGLTILGFSVAVFVEYKAAALQRWEYRPRMPRFLGLGLTPLVQMTVLLPLSVYMTVNIIRFFGVIPFA